MKILFVFTGGTIGSTEQQGIRSADPTKPYKIISLYKESFGIDFDYDTAEPYSELSENNTGLHITSLISCIGEKLTSDYDGIIVTHGTDTLQYTSAAIGYAFGLNTPPICLVSSNAPIEDKSSNALQNLRAAVCFIKEKLGRGVFSIYANDGETVTCHRGTRLAGSLAYSDHQQSIFGSIYGSFSKDMSFTQNASYSETPDEIAPFGCVSLSECSDRILVVHPSIGMVYPAIPESTKYILLNTYHSGTINTKSKALIDYLAEAKKKGAEVFALGVDSAISYDSASCFAKLGITPIKNLAPISAYMKLWLADAAGISPDAAISSSLSGDIYKA